jgi:hypothetical protein
MLTRQVLVRCCVLTVLMAPIAACTSMLGVEDRELNCLVSSREYPSVVADGTSTLTRTGTAMMTPRLVIRVDPTTVLVAELWNGFGTHGVVNAPGTYTLMAGDATPMCGICLNLQILNSGTGKYEIKYISGKGNLQLANADTMRLTGTFSNLMFERVNKDPPTGTPFTFVPVNNGCEVSLASVTFDKMYPP